MEIISREFIYIWYYFSVQLHQIFGYWVVGMIIGSVVSVFLKDKIHGAMRKMNSDGSSFTGIVLASMLGVASPLCTEPFPLLLHSQKAELKMNGWLHL